MDKTLLAALCEPSRILNLVFFTSFCRVYPFSLFLLLFIFVLFLLCCFCLWLYLLINKVAVLDSLQNPYETYFCKKRNKSMKTRMLNCSKRSLLQAKKSFLKDCLWTNDHKSKTMLAFFNLWEVLSIDLNFTIRIRILATYINILSSTFSET